MVAISYALVVGEALIDMVSQQTGRPLEDVSSFECCPGGAPANVAVGLARLGVPVRFVGVVGDDPFGRFLRRFLAQAGVDVQGMRLTREALTTLAFVGIREDGEREFVFYRKPGADTLLRPEDLSPEVVKGASILHHGTITLAEEPGRSALLRALEEARRGRVTISLDVNYREALWAEPGRARVEIERVLAYAHLLKMSREELELLSGSGTVEGARRLHEAYPNLALVVVTEGAAGSWAVGGNGQYARADAFRVRAVDTTGAGDAFLAAFLWRLWRLAERQRCSIEDAARQCTAEELRAILRAANAAGALTVQVRGAMTALPSQDEIEAFLQTACRAAL
ncbi:carbohydrate kinase family protein [Geochorda subterranea]|uniref:Carbohydrate kinase n=1 Tax=Geochorda subterranea TaxID=3109564 RepID=A0ABZ1BPD2_9FIRM|nr:carbohydrate kinase [Limnochorda sp. LNt]WRP14534.1 carbohydrate kinase [Limnochorda sp. LNt]